MVVQHRMTRVMKHSVLRPLNVEAVSAATASLESGCVLLCSRFQGQESVFDSTAVFEVPYIWGLNI